MKRTHTRVRIKNKGWLLTGTRAAFPSICADGRTQQLISGEMKYLKHAKVPLLVSLQRLVLEQTVISEAQRLLCSACSDQAVSDRNA